VIAKRAGTTTVARTARIAAGTVQVGFKDFHHCDFHHCCAMRMSLKNTCGA
jgi:hypothetical protein